MSHEVREVLHVELSSVRPPLWSTATRETRESEVKRRLAVEGAQPCHLPLYADPVAAYGMTPEVAEAKAVEHLRRAEKMLTQVTERGAPEHVVERFRSHVKLMMLQTKECPFRKEKATALPVWILVDGAHRWYVAEARKDPKIYLSVPRYAVHLHVPVVHRPVSGGGGPGGVLQQLAAVAQKPAPSAAAAAPPPPFEAKPATRNAVSKSTELGAYMNHISHVSTPMSNADRVFLLQSWYVAALDACENQASWGLLRDFLRTGRTVLHLLAVSVRRYRESSGAGRSAQLGNYKGMNRWADDGEAALKTLNDKVFFQEKDYIAGMRDKVYLELPPAMVLIVAATRDSPTQSFIQAPWDLVRCAMESVVTPMSRIMMGLALCDAPEQSADSVALVADADAADGDGDDDSDGDCDKDSDASADAAKAPRPRNAGQRMLALRVNSFEGLWRCITVRDNVKDEVAANKWAVADVRDEALTEVALILASAVGSVDVVEFHKPQSEKYTTPLPRYRLPDRALVMRGIVAVSMRAWLGGVPLRDVCTRLASVYVAVGRADLGLGKTKGVKLNEQDLSFLVRAEVKGIFVGVRDECGKEKLVLGHSTKCFLSHAPAVYVTTTTKSSKMIDREAAAAAATAALGTEQHVCDCDFFTEAAASSGVALKHAFFLSRVPLTDEYRKNKAAVARGPVAGTKSARPQKISLEDLARQMLLLKNGEQGEQVKNRANEVGVKVAKLEALRLVPLGKDDATDQRQIFKRRLQFLDAVDDLLQSLRHVAVEIGLAHYEELEALFRRTASVLEVQEAVWDGQGETPALETGLDAYEPSDSGEKLYKTVVAAAEAAVAGDGGASAASAVGALTPQQEIVRKWMTRVGAHKKGCKAREDIVVKEKAADRVKRRHAAASAASAAAEARNRQETGKDEKVMSHGDWAPSARGTTTPKQQRSTARPPRSCDARKSDETGCETGHGEGKRAAGKSVSAIGAAAGTGTGTVSVTGAGGARNKSGKRSRGDSDRQGAPSPGALLLLQTGARARKKPRVAAPGRRALKNSVTVPEPQARRPAQSDANARAQSPINTSTESAIDGCVDEEEERRPVRQTPAANAGTSRSGRMTARSKFLASGDLTETASSSADHQHDAGPGSPVAPKTGRQGKGQQEGEVTSARSNGVVQPLVEAGCRDNGAAGGAAAVINAVAESVVVMSGGGRPAGSRGSGASAGKGRHGATLAAEIGDGKRDCSRVDTVPSDLPEPSAAAEAEKDAVFLTGGPTTGGADVDGGGENAGSDLRKSRGASEQETEEERRDAVDSYSFVNVNEHKVSKATCDAAMPTLDEVAKVLPSTMAEDSMSKWLVTLGDLRSIQSDHKANSLTRAGAGKVGDVETYPLDRVLDDLSRDGVAIIVGAFDREFVRLDIDKVIDTPCDELKLLRGEPEDDVEVDQFKWFVPVPNPGGGRSMTGPGYWAKKEGSNRDADVRVARAAHRHLTRVCVLVEDIMACDVVDIPSDGDAQGDKNIRKSVVQHKCTSTGGSVLVTHPPTVPETKDDDDDDDGDGEDDDDGDDDGDGKGNLPEGALPQRPHIDFATPVRAPLPHVGTLPSRNRDTPMFVICTGRVGTALRVYKGSHTWSGCKPSVHNFLVTDADVEVVYVPPYSFLIMRGDCYHAGAGWLESKWVNDAAGVQNWNDRNYRKNGIARWHVHFRTRSTVITNAIHYAQEDVHTVFPRIDELVMPKVNGKEYVATRDDFSFDMRTPEGDDPHR